MKKPLVTISLAAAGMLLLTSAYAQNDAGMQKEKDWGYCVFNDTEPNVTVAVKENHGPWHYPNQEFCSTWKKATVKITVYPQGKSQNCMYYQINIDPSMRGGKYQYPTFHAENSSVYFDYWANQKPQSEQISPQQTGPYVGECGSNNNP